MCKLFWIAAVMVCWTIASVGPTLAAGERPYWPAYEPVQVPEGCIRWNWQQGSYYFYCPRVRGAILKSRG